ncbi:MAG: hypothetical protein AB1529_07755 [Candidatus Micrarchaeota archaeon]
MREAWRIRRGRDSTERGFSGSEADRAILRVLEPALLPMLQEAGGMESVRAKLQEVGFSGTNLDAALSSLMEPRNMLVDSARLRTELQGYEEVFEFGRDVNPLLSHLREKMPREDLKNRRTGDTGVDEILNMPGGEAALNTPIALWTRQNQAKLDNYNQLAAQGKPPKNPPPNREKFVGSEEIAGALAGFERQVETGYGAEFAKSLKLMAAEGNTGLLEEYRRLGLRREGEENGDEGRERQQSFLEGLLEDRALLEKYIGDEGLRSYILAEPERLGMLLDARSSMAGMEEAGKRVAAEDGSVTYLDVLRPLENMQKFLERLFVPVTFRVESRDGKIVYNITMDPATIRHFVEGHANETVLMPDGEVNVGTADGAFRLIQQAIAAQPYGRLTFSELGREVARGIVSGAAPGKPLEKRAREILDSSIANAAPDSPFTARARELREGGMREEDASAQALKEGVADINKKADTKQQKELKEQVQRLLGDASRQAVREMVGKNTSLQQFNAGYGDYPAPGVAFSYYDSARSWEGSGTFVQLAAAPKEGAEPLRELPDGRLEYNLTFITLYPNGGNGEGHYRTTLGAVQGRR